MDLINGAQQVFDKGFAAAHGAVSGVAVEQLGFVKGFVRLCDDGWQQGWHERNGGNLTYRMTEADIKQLAHFSIPKLVTGYPWAYRLKA